MKYCGYCGQVMDDSDEFCKKCGAAAIPTPDATPDDVALAEEREFINGLHRFLKYERISWKVTGIVFLVLAAIYVFFGFIFAVAGLASEEVAITGAGIIYMFTCGITFVPLAVINLVMVSKTQKYMTMIEQGTDIGTAITRAGSVGMIVFAAFFNEIALIFIIINFVRVKCNQQVIARIFDRLSMNQL